MGYKFEPAQKIIINDIDKDLMEQYEFIKSNPNIENLKEYSCTDIPTLNIWKDRPCKNEWDKFVSFVLKSNNTFGGKGWGKVYKTSDPYNKIKRIPLQAKKMKEVNINNECIFSLIDKFNSEEVFLYLDPPYENSKGLYRNFTFDFERLSKKLKEFKGKFLLSINASPIIKEIFDGFKFSTIIAGGSGNLEGSIGAKKREEYLIKNY